MARLKHTDDREVKVCTGPDILVRLFLIVIDYQLVEPI